MIVRLKWMLVLALVARLLLVSLRVTSSAPDWKDAHSYWWRAEPTKNSTGTLRRLPRPLPPMRELYPNNSSPQVTSEKPRPKANISSLLDFVVAGFPKCGTTTMGKTVAKLIHGFGASGWDNCKTADEIIMSAYNSWGWANMTGATSMQPLRGFKCPKYLERQVARRKMNDLAYHFPETKLILGVRHPVRWFESFYNFIVQTNGRIPGPYERVKGCLNGTIDCCPGRALFCTDRGRFHLHLAGMGKTAMSTEERELLPPMPKWFGTRNAIPNPVMLYEIGQMSDVNENRRSSFWAQIGGYLGYDGRMPMQRNEVPGSKPNKNPEKQVWLDKMKIDVCDPIWDGIRAILMGHAVDASRWILQYLLAAGTGVSVSNKEHFTELIKEWERDPCGRLAKDVEGKWSVNGTIPNVVVTRTENSTTGAMRWNITKGTVIPVSSSAKETPMGVGCGLLLTGRKGDTEWRCPPSTA
mmetsp:Transcript_10154/g.21517  ORF Transcript_10154/g.21517 Transcript_10154/m.21517 type:complete len:468 (+) Transcript_10154:320-1723(+)